jgi:hypothetical protein
MKVTQQTLPLFNEMYELKFSEAEMEKAFSVKEEVVKNLKNLGKTFKTTSLSNIQHIIDNGINRITSTMYINDSWDGRLEIHAGDRGRDEALTAEEKAKLPVPTTNSFFTLTPNNLVAGMYRNVSIKTLDAEQFYQFLYNLDMCKNLGMAALNKEELKILSDTQTLDDLSWLVEITSGPSILKKLKNADPDFTSIVNSSKQITDDVETLKNVLSWLMPNAKITDGVDKTLDSTFNSASMLGNTTALGYIACIFEQDNHRLGISNIYQNDYYRPSSYRRMFLLSHTDALFNYADVDRVSIYTKGSYSSWRYDGAKLSRDQVLGKILFTEKVVLPKAEGIEWIHRHSTSKETELLDASALKLYVKKFSEETKRIKQEKEEKELLEKKLKEKIASVKTGKKLILNGMIINKDSIEYEGQVLKRNDSVNWVYELLLKLTRIYKFDDLNWDSVFETFVDSISLADSEGQIGDVSFKVVYETSVNSTGVTSTRSSLNSFRINKNELADCLRRAVCYTNQDDFNEFLSNVSSCSLKFHRYLQTGVDFQVTGMRSNDGFSFKLPLERKKNIMYIVLGDNEYKVKDTNRLINMQNIRDLGEIMTLLLGDKVIEGMTLTDAKSVLKLAKIEYQDAIDKSKKLLEETEKTLKLTKQENIQMNEVMVKEGYIVNGKLRQYVVANTEKCEVYEYPTGRYICIVDKSTSQVGKDKLINRLYALTNDQALAQDIHTLN